MNEYVKLIELTSLAHMVLTKELEEIRYIHTGVKGRGIHVHCTHLDNIVQSAMQKGGSLEAGIRWDKTGFLGEENIEIGL